MNMFARFEDEAEAECCGGCQDSDEMLDENGTDFGSGDRKEEAAEDQELVTCKQEVEHWKEKCLRINADLENVRRRMHKEQEQALWRAQVDIFTSLLSVVDNFDRAQADLEKLTVQGKEQVALDGISLIRKDLTALFDRVGITAMSPIATFDPALHEALASVDAPNHQSGDIVDVLQKGYLFKGQVLRPAKVSVAR
jgi:molecular chaperone GrpE